MYIHRLAEDRISLWMRGSKILLLLGARQVGKTTLLKHCLAATPGVVFLNFDVQIDQQRFLSAASLPPDQAMQALDNPSILVIDEAQRLPQCASVIKGWYDSEVSTRFALLGSSSLDLVSQAAEALTGRNIKIHLAPFLWEEALITQPWYTPSLPARAMALNFSDALKANLLQRISFGSYPEAVVGDNKREYVRNLSADYLLKDILQIGSIRSPDTIRSLLQLLAHQVGNEVSVNELSQRLHTSRATIDRYLELLERTFVLFHLPSFSSNQRNEISKSKKYYFVDTGIRNALLNAFSTDDVRPDIGPLWENWVIAEVFKRNLLEEQPLDLFFWRTKRQSEVDLVVKAEGQLRAFEIKWAPRKRPTKAFTQRYGVPVETLSPENPFVAQHVFDRSGNGGLNGT